MLVALDLTTRQAARVLTQAVRTQAKLEIEPRPEACSSLLWGTLEGRDEGFLKVSLHDLPPGTMLAPLVGATCDVRAILAGQLCIFTTYILDAVTESVPYRLALATPQSMQLANRRRFIRRTPVEPVLVRLSVPGVGNPVIAILCNIGPNGLGCRGTSDELDALLFIGDELQVEFALPWSNGGYTLPVSVCSKTQSGADGYTTVGLEFVDTPDNTSLEQLREALTDQAARLIETEGGQ